MSHEIVKLPKQFAHASIFVVHRGHAHQPGTALHVFASVLYCSSRLVQTLTMNPKDAVTTTR